MAKMYGIKKAIKKRMSAASGLFSAIGKKVFFENSGGRQYSDNPRAISEKMHELFPEYEIVWAAADKNRALPAPDYVKQVVVNTPEYMHERTTAFAYVRNDAMTEDLYKKTGQVFIQTWHGDRGIKKILYDAWEEGKRPHPVMDNELTDLFVLGSDYAEKRIKTAFRYFGNTMKTGCPRNDCLIHPAGTDAVREKLGLKAGQKTVLYAPTLRGNHLQLDSRIDIEETLRALSGRGGEWVCLVRAHPKSLGVSYEAAENIMDVSAYPDMADLLMVTDMLITDYSSCAGDFIITKRPVILAHFDLELYNQENRTFYADPAEAGFLIARNQEEMNTMIDTMTDAQFAENCERVMRYFGTCETGHSAEDVCRWIDEHYRTFAGQ